MNPHDRPGVRASGELSGVVNLDEFEPLARARMSEAGYHYFAGGAAEEVTLEENVAAFRRYRLRPRVLVDVSSIDTSTEILGAPASLPFGMCPAALQGLAHPEGEVAAARAVTEAGGIYCLSTLSSRSLEDVAAGGGRLWFQLYAQKDREFTRSLVDRAVAAGYEAIMLTADLPVAGYRERELRFPLAIDAGQLGNYARRDASGELLQVIFDAFDQTLSWRDLEWLRSLSDLPLVLKGVQSPEDARLAAEHGADAIVVSNHGGRQLDRSQASIDALTGVLEATGGDVEVYLDSGVRRGADVVTAIALGARAVFVGRPFLYALAVGGRQGVEHGIKLLRAELETTMALLGAARITDISRSCVV